MSIHGQWRAGSEDSALEAGVIDALNGGHWRPPEDFPDAYNWAFKDVKEAASERPQDTASIVAPHQLAIVGIVHIVIFADKQVDPSEMAWLYEEARYHPVFAGIPFTAFRSACLAVLHDMHDMPVGDLLDIWAGAAQPHAKAALELAVGAMLADGMVAQPEEGVMSELIAKLGISRQDASAIFLEAFGLSKQ